MAIFIEKARDLTQPQIIDLMDRGYSAYRDKEFDETYYYDPKHWKLIIGKGDVFDFKMGAMCLKSQTIEAKELAIMDGYGQCRTK